MRYVLGAGVGDPEPSHPARATSEIAPWRVARQFHQASRQNARKPQLVGHLSPVHPSITLIFHTILATEWPMALVGFRGDGEWAQATSASIKEPSKAFPRLRTL